MIGKVLRWGNSYGVRLSKRDVEDLGLKEGAEVAFEVKAAPGKTIDLSWLPSYDLGGLADHIDEVDWSTPPERAEEGKKREPRRRQ